MNRHAACTALVQTLKKAQILTFGNQKSLNPKQFRTAIAGIPTLHR